MFKTVIGLEIHVQLKTKSKMFCGCDNKADEAEPNTLVCPVCLGLPGVLPVANRQAIEWVIKTGLALNCEIAEKSKFDRKHYYYPDLPKNYQISQYDAPFAINGHLEIRNPNDEIRNIRITRIHLVEDAGKLVHADGESLVDFNRTGTPLMEVVTEPDIQSPSEAKIFMQELRSILRYLDVSDADMEKGHLRADANISIAEIRKPNDEIRMGIPVEVKNLNSFRMVERALLYEEKRQKELLEKGDKIAKETRGWNDTKGESYSQRSKEFAQDYRYFPEPDLPPFLTKKLFDIVKLKEEMPELPAGKRKRIISDIEKEKGYASNIHLSLVQQLIDEPILEDHYNYFIEKGIDKLFALAFVSHQMWGKLKTGTNPDQFHKEVIFSILKAWQEENINSTKAKEYFELSLNNPESIKSKLEETGLSEEDLNVVIDKVISENPKAVSDIKGGKMEAMGFLVGLVMKETSGSANPQFVSKIIKERLQ